MKDFVDFLKSRAFFANFLLAVVLLFVVSWLVFRYLDATTDHGESIEVPQLLNKSFEQAQELLEANDLAFEIIDTVYEVNKPKNVVTGQIPGAFERVKEGRTIYLTINATDVPKVEMPALINQSLRQASLTLNIVGLKFDTQYRPDICTDCVLEQLYRGQPIAAGTFIPKGETVTLILGQAGGFDMPDTDAYIPPPAMPSPVDTLDVDFGDEF